MTVSGSMNELVGESLALERSGDIAASLRRAQEALEKALAARSSAHIAVALTCLAFVHFRLGHYDQAQALARQALDHAVADAHARVDALLILGMCATETDDLVAGEDLYLQAIDLSRQLGYPRALLRGLHNLAAGVYMPRGQFELALAADTEALRLAKEQGMSDLVCASLISLAWVYWLSGQHEQAVAHLNELRSASFPGSSAEGYYYCGSGNLALDEGRIDQAPALYGQARSIGEVCGEPSINILVRLGMSRYHRLNDAPAAARDWANDALTIAKRVGYRHFQGLAFIERARAAWMLDDVAAAEGDLRAAIDILARLGAAFDLTRARFLLAVLLHQQRRDEAVSAWGEAARDIIEGNYAFLLEQERALAFPLLASLLDSDDPNVAAISRTLLGHLARVPPPPLHVQTLGRFEVRPGRRPMEMGAFRQRRAGELLALLLITPGRALSSEQIAEALYPERPPGAARASFHHTTSALRRALEPDLPEKFPSRYLEVEEGWVTLHLPPDSWVDVEVFEAHCQRGEWEQALSLYGGEFLPEYRYADWAVAPRERLTLLYQQALLEAARARLAAGQSAGALDACRRLLALEPWHEEAVLLGMRACVALNDLPGARRLYLALEKALREDLGTAPQKELQAFYRSLTPPAAP